MPDLSTPLLDTLNNKLADPTLDCKTLEYNFAKEQLSGDSIFSEEEGLTVSSISSTASSSASSSQELVNMPTPTPKTLAPTVPLDCSGDFMTGPRELDGCTGYYHCVFGTPIYPPIQCPDNSLFDKVTKLCLPADQVNCNTTQPPSKSPELSTPYILLDTTGDKYPSPSPLPEIVEPPNVESTLFETTPSLAPTTNKVWLIFAL